jgi:putative N6-adenine-specific DNA methylase
MNNNEPIKFIARTFYGLEDVLAKELLSIGAREIKPLNRAVRFTGDLGFMYKANYRLKTAIDVLQTFSIFTFYKEEDFYKKLNSLPWEHYFGPDKTFRVKVICNNSIFNNSHYVALYAKDAIVDRFKDLHQERPDIDVKNPDVPIFIHIDRNRASVYLNSSGAPLFKRGYRTERHDAPINEVLASGLLQLAGWPKQMDFLDPMCGSGTMLIEALLLANNMPSGVIRKDWAFTHWRNFDKELWEKIQKSSLDKITYFSPKFYASDASAKAVMQTIKHLRNIKMEDMAEVEACDFMTAPKSDSPKFIISNPPYDKRIQKNLDSFYRQIGDMLKQDYAGSEAYFIGPIGDVRRNIGLKPSKKYKFYQGKIECEFLGFNMYKGSKRVKES